MPTHSTAAMTRASAGDRPAIELARWAAGAMVGLLAMMATVLCWRRLAGALAHPLPASTLMAVGLLVAVTALTARVLWRQAASRDRHFARLDPLVTGVPFAAIVAVAVALSLPGTSPGALAAFWAIVALEEGCVWLPGFGQRVASLLGNWPRTRRRFRVDPPQPSVPHAIGPPAKTGDTSEETGLIPFSNEVTQQLTRTQSADGAETLSGWLRVGLPSGQRTANVHVAFCPPFARTPTLEVAQTEGPRSRIKTVQLLPYGARLDLKLPRAADEPASVLLRFSAESRPAGEA